jgi:hypothetical protein
VHLTIRPSEADGHIESHNFASQWHRITANSRIQSALEVLSHRETPPLVAQASHLGGVWLSAVSRCFSFIALAALSRKKAHIVEPISHTWRNNSSYSSGRNFTVTRTVQADLLSVPVIRLLRYVPEEVRFIAPQNATLRGLSTFWAAQIRRRLQNHPPPDQSYNVAPACRK